MLDRLFELRDEVIQFLEMQGQTEMCVELRKPSVQVVLAYLSDIFDSLNLKLQVSDSTVIYHRDAITAYTDKLQLWKSTDPFHADIDALLETLQEQALEIENDSASKYDFEKMDKSLFWHLFIRKGVFSSRSTEKECRSTLYAAGDLYYALSSIQPRIENLCKKVQAHPSHWFI
ncbi:uncharacterized protein LOC126474588 [Schistocerca serialis cubense]|uniref:uncharacterized protein LOC126474588 n=1 Tax=Schistocerca serialis cubense TaxID=2023355 RepID=UPI00214ED91A|nr:uncharacterized protein LOC126474588 [Schistocerca serialis cubense]